MINMKNILVLFWALIAITCIICTIYARISKIKSDKKYCKSLKQINN